MENNRKINKRKRKQDSNDPKKSKQRDKKSKMGIANNPNYLENNIKVPLVSENNHNLKISLEADKIQTTKKRRNKKNKEQVIKSEIMESVRIKPKGSKRRNKLAEDFGKKTPTARKQEKQKESKLDANEICPPAEEDEKAKETKETDLIDLDDNEDDEAEDEEMNEIIEKYMAEQKIEKYVAEEKNEEDVDGVLVIDEIGPDEQVDARVSVAEEEGSTELRTATTGLRGEIRISKSKAKRGSLKRAKKEDKKCKFRLNKKQEEVERKQEMADKKRRLIIRRRKEKEDKQLKKEAKKLEKSEKKKKGLHEKKRVNKKRGKLERTIKHRMETVRVNIQNHYLHSPVSTIDFT